MFTSAKISDTSYLPSTGRITLPNVSPAWSSAAGMLLLFSSRYSTPAAQPIGPAGSSNRSAVSPVRYAVATNCSIFENARLSVMIQSAASRDTAFVPRMLTGTQPLSGPGVNEPAHVPGSGSKPSQPFHGRLKGTADGSRFERQTMSPVTGSTTASSAAANRSFSRLLVCRLFTSVSPYTSDTS